MRQIVSLLLLALALAVAACASMDTTLELRADGGGTRTVLVLVDETAYRLALVSGTDPLAQIAAEAGRRGATVEPYGEFARRGLRITQTFDRPEDIPSLPPLDRVIATRQSDLWGTCYTVTATVDAAQLATLTHGLGRQPPGSLELTYHVVLPGRIRTHNAPTRSGNTLTWILDPTATGVQTLTATAEVPHDWTAPYLAVGGVCIITLLAGVSGLALLNVAWWRRGEHLNVILSGGLGLAVFLALLVCLGLALLTGYLALEGRIFTLPTPVVSPGAGVALFGLTSDPYVLLVFALLVAVGWAGLLVIAGLVTLALHQRGSRAAPLSAGCLGGLLSTSLILGLGLVLIGGYILWAGTPFPAPATPTAVVRPAPITPGPSHTPSPSATPAPTSPPPPTAAPPGSVVPTLTPWSRPTQAPRGTPWPTVISRPVQAPAQERALIPAARTDLARLDDPARYTLDVNLDPAAHILTGHAEIVYTNNAPLSLDEVYLRLFANGPHYGVGEIHIDRVTIAEHDQAVLFEAHETVLRVALPAPLAAESRVTLLIDYQVIIPRNSGGYGAFGHNGPVINLAHWYPILAVYDEAGWHLEPPSEYGDPVYSAVGLYDVRVTAPISFTIVTSGVLVDKQAHPNGTTTWTYVSGPMRDFAIVASADYTTKEMRVGDTAVRAHYLPGDEADATRMLEAAAETLAAHNQRFGAYPYVELDMCEVNLAGGAAGIEFPGLIFIGRDMFLGEADILYLLEFVVAHEVGHEWWYGVVGNDQVNHPWLDEGLTNYSAIHYFEQTMDREAGEEQLALWMALPYASYLMLHPDMTVDQPASAFPNQEAYSAIVYGKGGLFFWKLRQTLGDEGYFQALQLYYERHKYGIARAADLLRAIRDATGRDVSDIYESWIAMPNGIPASDMTAINELLTKVTNLALRAGRRGQQ